ncbi:MAG: hypothetical protein AAF228_09265 [Pseudomonadota bacterium]
MNIIENTEEAPVLFHPNMSKKYHKEVQSLIKSLNSEKHRAEAAELIRSLVDRIVLTPTAAKDRLVVDLLMVIWQAFCQLPQRAIRALSKGTYLG